MKNAIFSIALLSVVLSGHVKAEQSSVGTQAREIGIKEKLKERFPDIAIDDVRPSQWPGLYEVVTQQELVYVSEDGELLFSGQIMSTKTKENFTAKRWNELNEVDFRSLPLARAIKTVKGDGHRKLAVFSDPYCPYCQQLEESLKSVTDITIYTFLYPLENVHPGATAAARNIWCAGNSSVAWSDWMIGRKAPPTQDCKQTPIEELAALGAKLKINSTPTLFFEDGTRVPGAVSTEELEKHFTAQHSVVK